MRYQHCYTPTQTRTTWHTNIRRSYVSSQELSTRSNCPLSRSLALQLQRIMSVSGESEAEGRAVLPQEDTVEYRLYSLEDDESSLSKMATECTLHAQHITREHIWHYDSFSLEVCAGKRGSAQPACLYGNTCFRDNVEDEWLIVYLLFSISRLYTQLVISVEDSDGQFLLIEAAHKLPPWLKPETAANRVFIHKDQLHIIPKPRSPAEVTSFPVSSPTVQEAVHIISDESIPTVASEPIQRCVRERIKRFSEDPRSYLHYAHCYVPLPVAHVMSHDQQLISAAVHALCERDPIDMKACHKMTHFSPRKHSMVMTGIKFTKCLYAQLLHQRFSSPRNSGFKMPPSGNQRHTACELGMKLTCGLEILINRIKHGLMKNTTTGESANDCEILGEDPRWLKFRKSLAAKGFFQNEIEGSRLYQQLLSSAKEYFVNHLQDENDEEVPPVNTLPLAGRKALHILQNIPVQEDELIARSKELKSPDDDSWLQITSEELDVMMRRAAGYLPSDGTSGQPTTADGGAKADTGEDSSAGAGGELDLQSMVYGMKSFVEKISSHEGAELPWTGKDSDEIDFDPDSVLDVMKTMLNPHTSQSRKESGSVDISESEEEEDDEDGVSDESSMAEDVDAAGVYRDEGMQEIMEDMDREIGVTEVGKSFEKMTVAEEESEEEDTEMGGALQPVDVDFNLVKNLLESYTSQEGGAGPTSNILQSLGIHIPEQ